MRWLLTGAITSSFLSILCCAGNIAYALFKIRPQMLDLISMPHWSRLAFSTAAILFLALAAYKEIDQGCIICKTKKIGFFISCVLVISLLFLPNISTEF